MSINCGGHTINEVSIFINIPSACIVIALFTEVIITITSLLSYIWQTRHIPNLSSWICHTFKRIFPLYKLNCLRIKCAFGGDMFK